MIGRRSQSKKRSRVEDIRIMNEIFPASDALAAEDGEPNAGAEYLLLAAFDLDDGSARRAFERSGANPDDFRPAVRAQHADALQAVGMSAINDDVLDQYIPPPAETTGLHRGAPSAHQLFRKVVKLVRKEKSQLYGAYFVLVAAETEHGTTARALRHMKVDPTELGLAARAEINALNISNT